MCHSDCDARRLPVCLTDRPLALWSDTQNTAIQPARSRAVAHRQLAASQNRKAGYVLSRRERSPGIPGGGSECLSANVAVLEPGTCRPHAPPAWGQSPRGRFCAVLKPVGALRESVSTRPRASDRILLLRFSKNLLFFRKTVIDGSQRGGPSCQLALALKCTSIAPAHGLGLQRK